VFDGQLTTAGADATDASSSAAPHTEILAISDDGSGGGGLTARSQASDRGSERSSQTGGQSSANMLMNNSIFVAKVSVTHHTITLFMFTLSQELGFALDDDGFAAKSLIDARKHRLSAAIASEIARNSKSQNIMSLEREKNLCLKGNDVPAADSCLCLPPLSRHDRRGVVRV
jgi:hypothetical protein